MIPLLCSLSQHEVIFDEAERMADKNEAPLTYDKVLQLAAPLAWIVLGLLGWSLDNQIGDFKSKLSSVETSVSQLNEQQSGISNTISEIRVRAEETGKQVAAVSAESRERGNQIERMTVIVNELLEVRRDERKSFLDNMNQRKGSLP